MQSTTIEWVDATLKELLGCKNYKNAFYIAIGRVADVRKPQLKFKLSLSGALWSWQNPTPLCVSFLFC